MVENYKETYLKQGSRAYRQLTMPKFKNMLLNNLKWKSIIKKAYDDDHNKGKILLGFKERELEDSDCDSDDEYI